MDYLLTEKVGSFTVGLSEKVYEGRKEMFYLTTHSTHFIYGYMATEIIEICTHALLYASRSVYEGCTKVFNKRELNTRQNNLS